MDFEKECEEIMQQIAEEEARNYVPSLKRRMKCYWDKYDAAMKRGEDTEIDDDYFMCEEQLKDMGIKYNPHKE